ncbi:oxidoreductase [Aureimonas sp. Leaf460]|nr:oxidoreductase [Aureimonas sp. Leaf427]KQT77275.1 oxidoreductase [Aureimonas sp. Leaf460]
MSRADGPLKVTGRAPYAIEHPQENLAYAVTVTSTIAAGRIVSIDTAAAEASQGVVAVYTHESGIKINVPKAFFEGGAATERFVALQDDIVRWNGQHIALVVAETFEEATEAARLVEVEYERRDGIIDAESVAVPPPLETMNGEWGDAPAALASAPVTVEAIYTTPRNYNAPMEPHACIASFVDGQLTVWEPSQWPSGGRQVLSETMGIDFEKVRLISPFTGGGFGCKVGPHPHVSLACAASRELGRPVKLSLTRPQTFTGYGGRPRTHQKLSLGATEDGKLVSIVHEGWNETAIDDLAFEQTNAVTNIMYATPNLRSWHSIIPTNTVNPGWMRGPNETCSAYALETAMDELAYKLKMDPLEFRLLNWADEDPQHRIPWSTRRLREAYAAGAEAFGWSARSLEPRSMREGRELIGWGMGAGTYPVLRTPSEAKMVLHDDGSIEVLSAAVDIGTGTYTILAQTAAEALGVPVERVRVSLGDTIFPRAALAGGSQLAGNQTGAVHRTALAMREQILALAVGEANSPLRDARANDLLIENGLVRPSRRPTGGIALADLMKAMGRERLEVEGNTYDPGTSAADRDATGRSFTQMRLPTSSGRSAHAWGVHFVEVRVDEDFGTVRVKRMVGAFDSGRIYNPKLAESQWIGGMIMGLSQALLEEGQFDPRDGRVTNANLADYAVAVNADIPDIQAISVGEPDYDASVLGGKAVGELGMIGVAPAVGNAVFHATGKRIRTLPITIERLI